MKEFLETVIAYWWVLLLIFIFVGDFILEVIKAIKAKN